MQDTLQLFGSDTCDLHKGFNWICTEERRRVKNVTRTLRVLVTFIPALVL